MLAALLAVLVAAGPDVTIELPAVAPPAVGYAAGELTEAWRALGLRVAHGVGAPLELALSAEPDGLAAEGFDLRLEPGRIVVAAGDAAGATYGLLELADWLPAAVAAHDAAGLQRRTTALRLLADGPPTGRRAPRTAVRAVGLSLTLPPPGHRWWFHDEDWWTGYLDLLAHARLNRLVLRGMVRLEPPAMMSLFPFLVTTPGQPQVGLPAAERERNLARLRWIVDEAERRGIAVALASHGAHWNVPGGVPSDAADSLGNLAAYAREATAQLIRELPALDLIGLPLREPTDGSLAAGYLRGVDDGGRPIGLLVDSRGEAKAELVRIGDDHPGRLTVVAAGGAGGDALPYRIAGRGAGWGDETTWPRPYELVHRLPTGGTHRLLPWADGEWARLAVRATSIGGGAGFELEAPEDAGPRYDRYHAPQAAYPYADRRYQNHRLAYLAWGRLGYDPDDALFALLAEADTTGRDAAARQTVTAGVEAGGRIVDLVGAAVGAAGFAPEFDPGPGVVALAAVPPVDPFVFQSVAEFVGQFLTEAPDPRLSPFDLSDELEQLAERARDAAAEAREADGEALAVDLAIAAHLADFWREKLAAAVYLGIYEQTGLGSFGRGAVDRLTAATTAWRRLAQHTAEHYAAVPPGCRHWRESLPAVEADLRALRARVAAREAALSSGGPALRHHPLRSSFVDGPLMIQADLHGLPRGEAVEIDALVEQRDASWEPHRLGRDDRLGWVALIDTTRLSHERIRYVLRARAGDRLIWLPTARQQEPFEVRVFRDAKPVVVDTREVELGRKPDRMTLRARTYWHDDDGLAAAWLWLRPMPGDADWSRLPADLTPPANAGEAWTVTADVRSTPEGALWAIEVIDQAGWSERWPMFRLDEPELPYRWIDPWDGPVTEEGRVWLDEAYAG